MAVLKKSKQNPKVNKLIVQEQHRCPEDPSFSFIHLTKNKDYNFEYFSSKMRKNLEVKQADLTKKLIEISQQTWETWYNLRKEKGVETLNYNQIHFSPNNLELSPDEKIIVFRFSSGSCRMLGIKGKVCSTCATYYIIGFDFNYTAYNHGG